MLKEHLQGACFIQECRPDMWHTCLKKHRILGKHMDPHRSKDMIEMMYMLVFVPYSTEG